MNKKNYNILYNKTEEELTVKDKAYISRVINLPKAKSELLSITIILSLILISPFGIMFFLGDLVGKIIATVFTLAGATTVIRAGKQAIKQRFKELNLTRKDLKELKKSGRLEHLKEIVKDIDLGNFSKIRHIDEEVAHYEKEKEEIQHYIDKSKEERKSLIQKLIEKYNLTEDEVSDLIEPYDYQDQQENDEIDYEQNNNL